jgi:FixJ family two-component response regulator
MRSPDVQPERRESAGPVVISIVEDDESFREALTGLVDAIGFKATPYASAEVFLESDGPLTSSCLITDVQLPGMNGLELSRRLASLGIAIPTIVVTAIPGEAIRRAAIGAGALALLHKPIDGEALSHLIRMALERRSDGIRSAL